jgi:hypothetical protein
MMSLVATGGGLLFGGDTEGKFRALRSADGKDLMGGQSGLSRNWIPD